MHLTLFDSAAAAILTSLITSAFAQSSRSLCTEDALYKGFFSNTDIAYDVNTFCVGDLGLTQPTVCDHTVTARTTIYPLTTITGTVTDTITTFDKTVTVYETGAVVLGLNAKRDAAGPARAAITEMPQVLRDVARSFHLLKKREVSADVSLILQEVYSACSCGNDVGLVDPGTSYMVTCAKFTSTMINPVRLPVASTVFETVDGGATTLTITKSITSNIISVISEMNASKPTWTSSLTSSWTGSWSDWTNQPTSTTTTSILTVTSSIKSIQTSKPASDGQTTSFSNSSPKSKTSLDTTTAIEPMTISKSATTSNPEVTSKTMTGSDFTLNGTTWPDSTWTTSHSISTHETTSPTAKSTNKASLSLSSDRTAAPATTSPTSTYETKTTTSFTTLPTSSPTDCPIANGTIYTSSYDSCSQYLRLCGLSFKTKDFYDASEYFSTPESCTTVCDAENAGEATPCLGVVWNTTTTPGTPNCRQLSSLDNPIVDIYAVALLYIGQSPDCSKSVSNSSTSSVINEPTFTMKSTESRDISTVNPTATENLSHSFSSTKISNKTTSYPTGTDTLTGTWNGSWTGIWNSTYSPPTGTGKSHSFNGTRSSTLTDGPTNSTIIEPSSKSKSKTGTTKPIATSNSTCPISTVYSAISTLIKTETVYSATVNMEPVTVYATQVSTTSLARSRCRTTTTISRTTEVEVASRTVTFTETVTETDGGEPAVTDGSGAERGAWHRAA